mgnify:CR=1 FL=1|tara:strand:+ start:515 stop:1333 length:819 start_codon:yes stop_codon:yes gene_type:complete
MKQIEEILEQELNKIADMSHVFEVQTELNPKIWERNTLKDEIRDRLMKIALDFYENLELDVDFEDIILTGSNAGYGWNEKSDIDLHIVVNFHEFEESEELMADLLTLKRMKWNDAHKITLNDHEVEIYIQNEQEDHFSPGQYSILRGEWLQEPSRRPFDVSKTAVLRKVESYISQIDHVTDFFLDRNYKKAHEMATNLKKRVSKMRKEGLNDRGINSVENLAFKVLRNADFIGKLHTLKAKSYDRMMSLDENKAQNSSILVKKWKKYLKGGG